MDIRIETFFTLYKTMNYHETARLMHITQPTVTSHIKSLESEYNCRFFIYDHKKLYKTREADIFEMFARSIMFNIKKLHSCLMRPKITSIRIGATKSIGEFMITDMVSDFLSNQTVTAEITVDNTKNLLSMIDNNEIDFALVEGNFSKVRYESQLFKKEPLYGICKKGHPFSGKCVNLEQIFSETLILREDGSGTRKIFSDVLDETGHSTDEFKRIVTVSEFLLLTGLVANGVGISFVYNSVAEHFDDIDTFSVKGINLSHELNYVYLKETFAQSLINIFRNAHA